MNKKGQGLSMNTIIITILVVLVLVVVAVFFTGGMASLINKIKGVVGSSAIDVSSAQLKCRGWCESYELTGLGSYRDNFCGEKTFDIDTDGDGKPDLKDQTCKRLNVDCGTIDDEDEECSVEPIL